jgi:hypothetical protein
MSTVNNGPQIVRSGLVLDLDASYMRSYSPNVMPNPTDIYAWAINGGSTSCTITRDSSQTRQYGSTPMKMAVTGNDPYIITINYGPGASSIWNLAPAANGQTWTISVYVKASVATTGELFLMPADSNGVVITSASGAVSITTSWTRVSFTYTISSATTAFIQCRLDGPNSGGSGINIWWDGLQVERASSATTFNPYYFGDTVWKDVSGNGRNGALTSGPLFNTSNKGNILFDGTNDNIQLGAASTFLPTSAITINCWAKTNVTGVYKKLFVTVTSGTQSVTGIYFSLGPSPDNIYLGVITNNGNQYAISTTNPSTSLFSNFCGTYDGANIKLYLNGALIATKAQTGTIVNTGIGRISGYDSNTEVWNGNIATFSIYNRALSAAEISQNYEATRTKFGL